MMCFDVNKLEPQSASSMLKALWSLTKNRMAMELLTYKYSATLLRFYKKCLSEYMEAITSKSTKTIMAMKELIPSISVLLVRMLSIDSKPEKLEKSDRDWKRFRKQSLSLLILTFYKSQIVLKMTAVFQSISDGEHISQCIGDGVINSMLSILVQIPLTLKKHQNVNREVVDLVHGQLEQSECAEIIGFTFNVLSHCDLKEKRTVNAVAKCFECAVNLWNVDRNLMTKIVLKYQYKVHELLSCGITLIEDQFDAENHSILNAAKHILHFTSLLTLEQNPEIQKLLRSESETNSLLHTLCRMPSYFMQQKKGRNLLFPAIIGLTFDDEAMLKLLDSVMNRKTLEQWLEGLLSSTGNGKQKKRCPVAVVLPSRMWRECLAFYRE